MTSPICRQRVFYLFPSHCVLVIPFEFEIKLVEIFNLIEVDEIFVINFYIARTQSAAVFGKSRRSSLFVDFYPFTRDRAIFDIARLSSSF